MRNVYEVLREKESQLEQIQRQVEALRMVVPMLVETTDSVPKISPHAVDSIVWKDAKTGRAVKSPW